MATDRQRVLDTLAQAQYHKPLAHPQGEGMAEEPGCGDVMIFTIATHREIITEIGYQVTESACLPLKAAAEVAARLAHEKPVMEAYLITAQAIAEALGGLDKGEWHCAQMAELALKRTLVDYVQRRN